MDLGVKGGMCGETEGCCSWDILYTGRIKKIKDCSNKHLIFIHFNLKTNKNTLGFGRVVIFKETC